MNARQEFMFPEVVEATEKALRKIAGSSKPMQPIGGTVGVLMNVRPRDIQIDTSYQRPLNVNNSRKIALGWDWRAYQPISLAMRPDGSFWCYDGQHRLVAAQMRPDLTELPCWVVSMSGAQEEAKWWIDLNANRKRIKPIEDYKARSVANDPMHAWMSEFLAERNLTPTGKPRGLKANETNAVSACIKQLMCKDGESKKASIILAFDVLAMAWDGQDRTYSGRAVEAMLRVVNSLNLENRELLRERATERLGRFTVEQILTEADTVAKARGKAVLSDLPRVIVEKFNYSARKHILML